MTNWRHRVTLTDVISDDDSSEAVAAAAVALHERLEVFRAANFPDDFRIEDISDEFHTIGFVDGPEKADPDHLNAVLSALYDWADENKVWIEGFHSANTIALP